MEHISLRNFKQELRDYQLEAVQKALETREGGRVMIAAPTGSGKGSMQLGLIHLLKYSRKMDVAIVTPSLEVMRGYLERCGARPEDLSCGTNQLAALGEIIHVYTPVRFKNAIEREDLAPPDYVILDECFPAGTMVGSVPIENIRVGDSVPSYCLKQQKIVYRQVNHVFRKYPSSLIRITHSRGTFAATPNHPVLTQRGWIPVSHLTSDDMMLHSTIWRTTNGQKVHKVGSMVGESVQVGHDPMCNVQNGDRYLLAHAKRVGHMEEDRASLLFLGMQTRVHPSGIFGYDGPHKPTRCPRADEDSESHVDARCKGSDANNPEGKRVGTSRSGREWSRNDRTRKTYGLCPRMDSHRCTNRVEGERSANTLQDRCGECTSKGGHRDRWPLSRSTKTEETGSQERGLLAWARVECSEVLKPGSDKTFGGLCPNGLVYNLEVEETHTYLAEGVVVHNCHHAVETNLVGGGLFSLCEGSTFIGFTATPFRGNPTETDALRAAWGDPQIILTIPQAVERKAWALPEWEVIPIINDDDCPIVRGDLDTDEATINSIGPLAGLIRGMDLTLPTCVTLNSVEAAEALSENLKGDPQVEARTVLGDTPTYNRAEAYERVKRGGCLLISVKVLGEGVDMPWLRRWIDASPTLSPVSFLQKLGRITRPNGANPQYVGTNRNLERHGYLLQGCLPRAVIKMAQDKFGGASTRGGRAGLLKGIGRAKPIELPLRGGVKATMWFLYAPPDDKHLAGYERCIMLDPTSEKVVSAKRPIRTEDGAGWGKWDFAPLPDKVEGFKPSKLKGICTDKQMGWWKKAAERYGLDASAHPNKSQFSALPVLVDLYGEKNPIQTKEDATPKKESTNPFAPPPPKVEKKVEASVSEKPFTPTPLYPETPGESPVKFGYYTVVREDGRRTYRVRTMPKDFNFAPGKTVLYLLTGRENTSDYTGVGFVDSRGLYVWKKFVNRAEEFKKDWASIIGDVEGAGKRYALHSGNCYRCGRLLTTPESISVGIGPVCEGMD